VAGCEPKAESKPAERAKVSLVLDWVPNTNHTGLYVARSKGYFEDENIEIDIFEPATGGGPQVVAAGQADFGINFQEFMTPARAEGVPVVSVAAIIQHNTSGFASLKSKGVARPRDLEGLTYGGFGSPLETALLQTMMEADGGDFSMLATVDAGAADFLTIIQRDVDLYWIFFGWQGVKAELEGIEIDTLFVKDWGVPDYYTPLIITSEALIAEKPDLVTRTMNAISRGYEDAIADPAGAAEILLEAAPETDADLVGPSQEWLSPRYQADAPQWGYQAADVWQTMSEWMASNGLVEGVIDWQAAYTNDFLPSR
jgi:ABC-type nitrate/sulfonate/bicarbonate transport system substrate-binding protein